VREYKKEPINSNNEEGVIKSTMFSFFSLGKERARET